MRVEKKLFSIIEEKNKATCSMWVYPNEIREYLYFLDTMYQVRPAHMPEAEDRLITIYNISKSDARLVVQFWRYVKTPGSIN